jgi:hypothetical protein
MPEERISRAVRPALSAMVHEDAHRLHSVVQSTIGNTRDHNIGGRSLSPQPERPALHGSSGTQLNQDLFSSPAVTNRSFIGRPHTSSVLIREGLKAGEIPAHHQRRGSCRTIDGVLSAGGRFLLSSTLGHFEHPAMIRQCSLNSPARMELS